MHIHIHTYTYICIRIDTEGFADESRDSAALRCCNLQYKKIMFLLNEKDRIRKPTPRTSNDFGAVILNKKHPLMYFVINPLGRNVW